MRERALNLLGLMRKANALQIGENDTGAAARAFKAKLVIVASDASDNAVKRAKGFVYGRGIKLITVPFTKDEIAEHLGKSGCSMAAICDLGFADAFIKLLCELCPDEYSEEKAYFEQRIAEMKKSRKASREKQSRA